MPWSPHVSITAMPSSVVFLINSFIVSKLSRTLLPGSSPTPNHLTTSLSPSSSFSGFLFNNGLTTKFYC
ncbi:hypothetical protein LDENG_00075960 [Lucifuga dentata]|nr:hypothetical protein LDENG_00075960 [Lucifuga dentata]